MLIKKERKKKWLTSRRFPTPWLWISHSRHLYSRSFLVLLREMPTFPIVSLCGIVATIHWRFLRTTTLKAFVQMRSPMVISLLACPVNSYDRLSNLSPFHIFLFVFTLVDRIFCFVLVSKILINSIFPSSNKDGCWYLRSCPKYKPSALWKLRSLSSRINTIFWQMSGVRFYLASILVSLYYFSRFFLSFAFHTAIFYTSFLSFFFSLHRLFSFFSIFSLLTSIFWFLFFLLFIHLYLSFEFFPFLSLYFLENWI